MSGFGDEAKIRRVGSCGVAGALLSWLSHYPPPRAWSAIGDAYKQDPLPVHENFALAVLVSGWPTDTRSGSEMRLRARSLELTAVEAHA
jgi:hypothetical protein